ncbi:putative non-specific serine/threonine protein kinase [Helianthus annuus]|nr:putative non-specific serine/threonine protein kinase [Helianthus annuus]KAJ0883790.1 putative non-specific serine/threonine protein kinase [Helianthus annuus]
MSSASISGTHILLLSLTIIMIIPSSSQSNPLQILLKFETNLSNSNTKIFTSWIEHNPVCNFTGIVCDCANNVKEINLSEQLAGTVDFGFTCSLELLQKVSLGSNLLHGTISSNLSYYTSLQHLGLENNSFNGQFPWKSLVKLTNLTHLSLGDNPIDISPFPLERLNLWMLQTLYLTNCNIQGTIPEDIRKLESLQRLGLSDNFLVGEILDIRKSNFI